MTHLIFQEINCPMSAHLSAELNVIYGVIKALLCEWGQMILGRWNGTTERLMHSFFKKIRQSGRLSVCLIKTYNKNSIEAYKASIILNSGWKSMFESADHAYCRSFGCLKIGNERANNQVSVPFEAFYIFSRCGSVVIAHNITYCKCLLTACTKEIWFPWLDWCACWWNRPHYGIKSKSGQLQIYFPPPF